MQANLAVAWGTSSCPKVEKNFEPGNQYVTAAKMILQGVRCKKVSRCITSVGLYVPGETAVEKFFGPGNQLVTAAKMIFQNSEVMVSVDMPAGPSEVLFIADKHASPVHIAADLLFQAEHGPDSQAVLLIAGDGADVEAIEKDSACSVRLFPVEILR
ncbi:hypothetical protein MKW98_013430 [Papaver atlanticum]|uniref:Histidinol dehydrogenase n=1 Tax=Papaver atlanticum TaxID=357466 RepID=A0AAD4SSR7_9MAGN|nr:hypothetical protein MKW98_013430 [Papaver atlanticum]